MTRLTNDLRDSILSNIMRGLPNVDYVAQIKALMQDTIIEFAPRQVQELYADEATRGYLNTSYAEVRDGNRRVEGLGYWNNVYGLTKEIAVQMDERSEAVLKEGTLYHALYTRLKASDLVNKFKVQEELRKSVRDRLRANLAAATTIKKLYEILEPELHGFIPREVAGDKMLPACVAHVVDDLKKLGLVVPDVPKAEAKV
jgi:hypothetical protein